MKKRKHPFHQLIGDIISENISGEGLRILKDPACDPDGHVLPLYYSKVEDEGERVTINNSRSRIFTNVDLLILKKNKIKVIIEIEESNVKPIHIFGKFFAAAFSSFYSHHTEDQNFIEMADSVLFVQILDTENIKIDKTQKIKQWENIKKSIKEIIPIADSKTKKYRLLYGKASEFGVNREERKELVGCIRESVSL